jgi:hypothetical protein
MMKAQIVGGGFGKIRAREKGGSTLEIGELLISATDQAKILLQVVDSTYASQIPDTELEMIAGINLEENDKPHFFDQNLRNYRVVTLKNLITIKDNKAYLSKTLPPFFSILREINPDDLSFLVKPKNPLFIGNLRSGSKELNLPITINGEEVFSHHILIPATTGRGKSNLTSCILWNSVQPDYCGILVLDPHDEYFGRNKKGLKDHPEKNKIIYYTSRNPPPMARTLTINIKQLTPMHFRGVVDWSGPQQQLLYAYYKKYGDDWILSLIVERPDLLVHIPLHII